MHNIHELVKEHRPTMVDIKFADVSGRMRHVTLPIKMLESVLEGGVGVDGSSVGFSKVHSSDLRVIPDPETAWMDPFCDEPTVSLLCNVVYAGTDEPYPLDPRGIAIKAEQYLQTTGVADRSLWGPEPEFYLFESVSYGSEATVTHAQVSDGIGDHGYRPGPGDGYHGVPPADAYHNVRSEMVMLLQDMGIDCKYHHCENGVPGQSEIEPKLLPLVKAADAVMIIKYVVKNVAYRHGLTATFMPKPLHGEAGNGMHVHQQFFKGTDAVFYGSGYAGLSDVALQYIGGLLKKSSSLTGLIAPSTNSYRRLVPGHEAPTRIAFAEGNRTASVRVPAYATDPGSKRLEYRPPDPTANPYLLMSGLLMAGLWGVENSVDPQSEGYGPVEGNIDEDDSIQSLPGTLSEALCELESDYEYLTRGQVFCSELIERWVELKRDEMETVDIRPHPQEFVLYYDC